MGPLLCPHHALPSQAIRDHYPGIRLLAGGDLGEGADFDIWEAHMLLPPNKLFEHARRALDAYQVCTCDVLGLMQQQAMKEEGGAGEGTL